MITYILGIVKKLGLDYCIVLHQPGILRILILRCCFLQIHTDTGVMILSEVIRDPIDGIRINICDPDLVDKMSDVIDGFRWYPIRQLD
jgi:hypothetical protein